MLPVDVANDREPILQRAVRDLPDSLVLALVYGLEKHSENLTPGRLYAGKGGCAVGVMLRELFPVVHHSKKLFASRKKQKTIAQDKLGKEYNLHLVELAFDSTVRKLQMRGLECNEASYYTGKWMANTLRHILSTRHQSAREGLFIPATWSKTTIEKEASRVQFTPSAKVLA